MRRLTDAAMGRVDCWNTLRVQGIARAALAEPT